METPFQAGAALVVISSNEHLLMEYSKRGFSVFFIPARVGLSRAKLKREGSGCL